MFSSNESSTSSWRLFVPAIAIPSAQEIIKKAHLVKPVDLAKAEDSCTSTSECDTDTSKSSYASLVIKRTNSRNVKRLMKGRSRNLQTVA